MEDTPYNFGQIAGRWDAHEVRTESKFDQEYWCARFGCQVSDLTAAIKTVGSSPETVAAYLSSMAPSRAG